MYVYIVYIYIYIKGATKDFLFIFSSHCSWLYNGIRYHQEQKKRLNNIIG